MKFRKNAIVVEARQVPILVESSEVENNPIMRYVAESIVLAEWCGGRSYMMHSGVEPDYYYKGDPGYDHILIPTEDGEVHAKPGDWIVLPPSGRFDLFTAETFAKHFTPLVTKIDPGDAEAFRAARLQFLQFQIQSGHIGEVGVNGCFVEDLIDAAIAQVKVYQSDVLACPENEATLAFLKAARASMDRRRANRVAQGVANSYNRHEGTPTDELIAELDPHHQDFTDEADVRPIFGQPS